MRGLLGMLLWGLALGLGAQPLDRASLEMRLDLSLESRIAEAEQEGLRQRLRAQQAESGPRLFGALGASQVRDVVTQDLVRSYPALSGQVGLRWPLLGAAASEERARTRAEAAAEQGRWQGDMARNETLRALRLAYVESLRAGQREQLARDFLIHEAELSRLLARRRQQGLLLEADYREFLTQFGLARRDQAVLEAGRDAARRQLAALTGSFVGLEFSPPDFRTACLDVERLLAGSAAQPSVRLAQEKREAGQRQLALSGAAIPEAGLILSQGLIRELGGQGGGATYLGVEFRLPLDWRRAADARRAEALAELERADLAARRDARQFELAARQAFGGLQAQAAAINFARQRLDAALAAYQGAELRLRRAEGDVIEKWLQARFALYRAGSDYVDAALAFDKTQIEILALGAECPESEGSGKSLEMEESLQTLAGLLGKSLALAMAAPASPRSAPSVCPQLSPRPACGEGGWGRGEKQDERTGVREAFQAGRFGWYAWAGGRWLGRAGDSAWMARLARRSSRILLSFNGREMAELARPSALSEQLERFIPAAHRSGVAVELLLGDSAWLAPEHREGLLRHLRALSRFGFDGVNLDLERSQSSLAEGRHYSAWLLDTVRAAARESAWPIALSVHYREAADTGLVEALRQAGLRELCLMVYVSDPERVEKIVIPVLEAHPELRIAVAQSVEPQLPSSESLARRGRARSLLALRQLEAGLRRFPHFAGVRVQSLEAFIGLKP